MERIDNYGFGYKEDQLSLTALERETVITLNDEEGFAEIYTSQRPWITRLSKNPSAELLEEGRFEGSKWAKYKVPKGLISVRAKSRKGQIARPGLKPPSRISGT
jgi:hypothetical protein